MHALKAVDSCPLFNVLSKTLIPPYSETTTQKTCMCRSKITFVVDCLKTLKFIRVLGVARDNGNNSF